ncbi:Pheophorbide a oxygenase, chloroplastic [Tetrabaena socialis]|uniref:Pheophorbide a oxygenase, chloroplastic n=1 Tax=Tetrabaena socialis TaxID=47790 RepID=A0A2J7ZUJ2_9CHLO|nr:Pheophorbide a oxygenase, chloroplastic [Tetrabaena socialis]|eukprot:PNH03919.1 Pheophorbide a oxygenase, chloroplastic [Tetrabaena socialis]
MTVAGWRAALAFVAIGKVVPCHAKHQHGPRAAWTHQAGWTGRPQPLRATPAPATAVGAAAVAQETQALQADQPGDSAARADAASTSAPPTAEGAGAREAPFVWTKHWWPLMPLAYLRPDRPNAVTLLGMPMVAWRDGSGSWRVFKDQCPHRLAPLSGEGKPRCRV